ncbi:hypothetical protein [Bordetella ansorpii]|nr:hypothetical protein [Bordetella ansorpii]
MKISVFAGVAQLVEQRIRNHDAVVVVAEAEGKHDKAFGPPAV